MLNRLSIKNFALIRDLELHLGPGFTVITGETGVGKSLLVGAVSFLAGGKAAPGIIRDGQERAVVEAEFAEGGGMPVIIRRELRRNGHSRAFLNDSPAPLKELAAVAAKLVDITAQRAFSHLLDRSHHLDFLDRFAGTRAQRMESAEYSRKYQALQRQVGRLERQREEFRSRRELLQFQLGEIEAVDPQPGEDEELAALIRQLEHLEDIRFCGGRLSELLADGDSSVEDRLAEGSLLLERLADYDAGLKELIAEYDTARLTLREIARRVGERSSAVESAGQSLDELRERHLKISGLIKKFGGSMTALQERWEALREEVSRGDATAGELEQLLRRCDELVADWSRLAAALSKSRTRAAQRLQKAVTASLAKLGVPKGNFEVWLIQSEDPDGLFTAGDKRLRLDERGIEDAEFYFSANVGIEPKPLAQVASGGELSRLMLALKESIPAAGDEATVVFDEIDTGISGRVARMVGEKLRHLAAGRQLIAITHLPQIAGMGEHHLRVSKRSGLQGMETVVEELETASRLQEIAGLISGGSVSESALQQAKNLLMESPEDGG